MKLKESRKFKANIWKMHAIKFLIGMHFVGAVLIPFFVDWGNLNMTKILFLQSWFMFWVFALEIPTGAVADYWGRKHSILLGALFTAFGCIIYVINPTFLNFLIAEFLLAMGASLISGADMAIIYETLKKIGKETESKKFFTRTQSFFMFGMLVAAPIGSLIAAKFGLQYPLLFTAIPFFLAAVFSLSLAEPQEKEESESTRYVNTLRDGFNFFRRHKILKILAFDFVSISFIGYFIIWLYQFKLLKLGFPIIYFGFVHAAMIMSEIVFMNVYTKVGDWIGSKKIILMSAGIATGPLFILSAFSENWWIIIVWTIVGGGLCLSRLPLFSSYFNTHIDSDKTRATILSTISMFRMFLIMAFNPLVGYLADVSLGFLMLVLGVLSLGFSFISRVKEEHLA